MDTPDAPATAAAVAATVMAQINASATAQAAIERKQADASATSVQSVKSAGGTATAVQAKKDADNAAATAKAWTPTAEATTNNGTKAAGLWDVVAYDANGAELVTCFYLYGDRRVQPGESKAVTWAAN